MDIVSASLNCAVRGWSFVDWSSLAVLGGGRDSLPRLWLKSDWKLCVAAGNLCCSPVLRASSGLQIEQNLTC